MNDDSKRRINFAVVGGLAAAVLTLIVLLTVNSASAGYTGVAPPTMLGEDWDITTDTHVWDQDVYTWDANITVYAGNTLTLHNVNVYFIVWSNYDYYDFNVEARGTLMANHSLFSAWNAPFGYYWDMYMDGVCDINHCTIEYAWNFTISGTAKFYNSTYINYVQQPADLSGTIDTDNAEFYRAQSGIMLSGTFVGNDTDFRYTYGGINNSGSFTLTNSEIYRAYDTGINNSGTWTMDNCNIRYTSGLLNTGRMTLDHFYTYNYNTPGTWFHDGTTTILNSTMFYIYTTNVTGSLTIVNTTLTEMREGMNFMGDVTIRDCDFSWMHNGMYVTSDNVLIVNTTFTYTYDRGIYFKDSHATLNNVTLKVPYGLSEWTFVTDEVWSYENRFPIAMGTAIWVVGGFPTFIDVDVEADVEARFHVEYTGNEREPTIYVQAMAAPVLIDSTEMDLITGLTVHDANFNIRVYITATNPGMNPLYFYGDLVGMTAGIGVLNYSDVTITDVVSYSNWLRNIYGPYMSGAYYGGSGWNSYGPQVQVGSIIIGEFDSAPTPKITLRDMDIMDGTAFFGHMFLPDYTGTGVPRFMDTISITNLTVRGGRETVFGFQISSAFDGKRETMIDLDISKCYFTDMYNELMYYYLSPGPGIDTNQNMIDVTEDINFSNNTITHGYHTWAYVYIEGVYETMPSDDWFRTVTFADNDFVDSWGAFWDVGGVASFVKGKEVLNVLNNDMHNVTDGDYGSFGPYYTYFFDTLNFIGNSLKDMAYGETGDFYDPGGDRGGAKPADWLFKDNVLENCTNERWSEVIFLEFGGDVRVDGNEVFNSNGFFSIYHETQYCGYATMDFVDNDFHDNTAYILEYGNTDAGQIDFTVEVWGNEFYNNEDYLFTYWGSSTTITQFNHDGTFVFHNNTFHNNTGGLIDVWGKVTVRDNDFFDNAGPLLYIDFIERYIPVVTNNVMANNGDLYVFIAKDRGYQLVSMTMSDEQLRCTGTALRFSNFDVVLDQVDIMGAKTAINTFNTYVNLYSSNIDGKACKVRGEGSITAWWSMEVMVTWGDKMGTDSGTPVDFALVVFNDADGNYVTSAYTDDMGMLARDLYSAWYVDLSGFAPVSPYTVKGAKAGVTNDIEVVLDKELIDDDRVHLVLLDVLEPVVAITEPYDGAIFAKDAMEALGFVTEVGSGLASAEYSTDDGATWMELTIGINGEWSVMLEDLMDGDVEVMVRAMDVASNTNVTVIGFTVDTTPPSLSVDDPPEIVNDPMITLEGIIEVGAELFVNAISMGIADSPGLSVEYTLHEGVNYIHVMAVDAAGNSDWKGFYVELDTHSPVLVLYRPVNMMVTNMGTVTFSGYVELGATLTIGGDQVVPDDMGKFEYDYELEDGEQTISVKAVDTATNEAIINRTIELDQDPPSVTIQSPSDNTKTSEDMVTVSMSADDDAVLVINGRRLPDMGDVEWTVLLVEGPNLITVTATDPAGNVATESITVLKDTYPPGLVVTNPPRSVVWTKADTLTVSGMAEGATSVMVGGQTTSPDGNGNFSATVNLAVGENNITVTATDGANEVTIRIKAWVNRDTPLLTIVEPPGTVETPSVTIEGVTDEGIRTVMVEYSGVTQSFPVDYTGEFSVTLNLPDGSNVVKFSVMDVYGNDAEKSITVNVDTRDWLRDVGEEGGLAVSPAQLGLILAVIGIVLIIAAFWAAYSISRRRREQLEEEM